MKHRYENDALSVERLVRELQQEEKSVVIAYKHQGKKDEAFPQLGEGSLMFEKHSARVVYIDSTHKTNPYGFKLVTVVVPDEFKNGKKYITISCRLCC